MADLDEHSQMNWDTPLFRREPSTKSADHEADEMGSPQGHRPASEDEMSQLQAETREELVPVPGNRSAAHQPQVHVGDVGRMSTKKDREAEHKQREEDVRDEGTRWMVKRYTRGEIYIGQSGPRNEKKGVGLLENSRHHVFIGEWEADRYKGVGMLQTNQDQFHLGEFFQSKADGPGLARLSEHTFFGRFKLGSREGAGEEVSASRRVKGYWQSGVLEGYGELKTFSFERKGYWVNGIADGPCVETQGGYQFVGTLQKSLKHGPGVLFKDGLLYTAAVYRRGFADGYAQSHHQASSSKFEGVLLQGVRQGPGRVSTNDGKELIFGEYSKDVLSGVVLNQSKAEKEFLGHYKNGTPDGLCLEKGKGWCYFGYYRDGVRHGWAYENKSGREFTGRYVNGKQQGLALLQLPGVPSVGGNFENGKLAGFSEQPAPLGFKEQLPLLDNFVHNMQRRIAHLRLALEEAKAKWNLPQVDQITSDIQKHHQSLSAQLGFLLKQIKQKRQTVYEQLSWIAEVSKGSSIPISLEGLLRGLRLCDPALSAANLSTELSQVDIPLEAFGIQPTSNPLARNTSDTHFLRLENQNRSEIGIETHLNKSISAVMAQNPNASLAEWMDVFTGEHKVSETSGFERKRLEEIFPPRSPEKQEAQPSDLILDEDYLADDEFSMIHMKEIPGPQIEEMTHVFRIEVSQSSDRDTQSKQGSSSSPERLSPDDQQMIEISDMGEQTNSGKRSLEASPELQPISLNVIQQPLKSIPEETVEEGSDPRVKHFNTESAYESFGTLQAAGNQNRNPLLVFKRDLNLYAKIIDEIKLSPRSMRRVDSRQRAAWQRDKEYERVEQSGSSFSMMSNKVDFQIEDMNPQLLETSQDSAEALFQAFNEEYN